MPAWVSFLLFRLNNGGFFSFLPSPFNNRIPALTLLSSRFSPCKSKAKRLRKPFENQHSDFLYAQKPDTWARIKISLLTSFLSSPGNIPSSLYRAFQRRSGVIVPKKMMRGAQWLNCIPLPFKASLNHKVLYTLINSLSVPSRCLLWTIIKGSKILLASDWSPTKITGFSLVKTEDCRIP